MTELILVSHYRPHAVLKKIFVATIVPKGAGYIGLWQSSSDEHCHHNSENNEFETYLSAETSSSYVVPIPVQYLLDCVMPADNEIYIVFHEYQW